MQPVWYYSKDDDAEYFTVYTDANSSSSKRRFTAVDGVFIHEAKAGDGTAFNQAFQADIRSAHCLGSLAGRLNLQDAVMKGRLSDDVLAELRRLKKSIVG
jgi:hypothetical protein